MKNFKYKFLYLFITIAYLFLSKVTSNRIIYLGENVTSLESNGTESITNSKFPYFPNISNDTFNNTQGNIIKGIIGFDSFIFDIAKNITSGMRLAQFFILNKTKTFILPFIMFPDEKSFEDSTLNETEADSSKLENLFPINISLLSPKKSNSTNSTLEETLFKPEMFITYLRGSHKVIRYNDTTNENVKNFTNVKPVNDSEKIINSTLIRSNKYLILPSNDSFNVNNQTGKQPRFLQFTSAYGLENPNQEVGSDFNYGNEIPNVGSNPSFAPDYDQWAPPNNFDDLYNGFGFNFLFME